MKRGLVLEGGGMRGLFSEGIIDVMQEEGITVDGIIGVSAGALFGCNFKSHQVGRGLRYNIRFKDDPRYMGWRSFLTTGNLVNPRFAYHTMPLELDVFDCATFEADPTEFHLVCCDIQTGKPIYKKIDHVEDETLEWFRATSSMPIVSTPVEIDGMKLLDGGLVDCIPLQHFQSIGYERNIVILTRPKGYQKTPNKLTPLFRLFHHKYPKIAECMKHRHEMYNAELQYIDEQARKGNILAIYPDHPLDIGRTELNEPKLRAIYQHGREKATTLLNEIRTFLNPHVLNAIP
jgi:predicted patatin/cPLA2 family phospholipase